MSEQNAAVGMKSAVVTLTNRLTTRVRTASTKAQTETGLTGAAAAEYWAKRTMWVLVIITISWDIAVTFHKHFASAARWFF